MVSNLHMGCGHSKYPLTAEIAYVTLNIGDVCHSLTAPAFYSTHLTK
jgi:hypothetical protein